MGLLARRQCTAKFATAATCFVIESTKSTSATADTPKHKRLNTRTAAAHSDENPPDR